VASNPAGGPRPWRGEIWLADFGQPFGHEQGFRRPCVIVSDDTINQGPSGLCVVVPLTSRDKGVPLHLAIAPPEGGLRVPSWAKPEDIRSLDTRRLLSRWGAVSRQTADLVDDRLKVLLKLR
jgi:mRNA interferase MazF